MFSFLVQCCSQAQGEGGPGGSETDRQAPLVKGFHLHCSGAAWSLMPALPAAARGNRLGAGKNHVKSCTGFAWPGLVP